MKCVQSQEFVIGGFSEPQGRRQGIGALLIGVHGEDGKLRYAGKVGTGFTDESVRQLRRRLDPLEVDACPFEPRPRAGRGVHWVKPSLVAEIGFSEWTKDARLRHPSFKGLREDKFIDYLRNLRGATSVAAYSTRAREGAPVSTPLGWDELDERLLPERFTISSVPHRLAGLRADPWRGYSDLRQRLPRLAASPR